MSNKDTVELLKECNSGIKMGVNAIDEVYDNIRDKEFKSVLNECKEKHQALGSETHEMLNSLDSSAKEPNIMARSMSKLKTNTKMSLNDSDSTAADLITDGCNMGVKSLNKYLNRYSLADERAKDIAKRLINLEADLASDIVKYL